MNNERRKTANGRTSHTVVTATPERKAKVLDEFADQERRQREYNAEVAAGIAERARAKRIALGEEPAVALHDDRGYAQGGGYDDPPVRMVGSGTPATGRASGWAQLVQRAQQAIQVDAGSHAERGGLDPDAEDVGQPKATRVAKLDNTPPKP